MKDDRKLLAEWFWTDRWMGSSAFLLPLEPRGLYREMLTQAWRRGASLPADHEAIRRAVGCTPAEWRRCWPVIEKYWYLDGDLLRNETQMQVYAEAQGVQQRAHERGVKGARARAQARTQVGTQVSAQVSAQAQREQSLKTQPPSPSPSPTHPERSPGDTRARVPVDVDRVRAFVDRYRAFHQQFRGVPYLGNDTTNYQEACTLVANFPDGMLDAITVHWLNVPDDKFTEGRTRTIAQLRSRASKYAEELKAKRLA